MLCVACIDVTGMVYLGRSLRCDGASLLTDPSPDYPDTWWEFLQQRVLGEWGDCDR
jgi:hypothetical protein